MVVEVVVEVDVVVVVVVEVYPGEHGVEVVVVVVVVVVETEGPVGAVQLQHPEVMWVIYVVPPPQIGLVVLVGVVGVVIVGRAGHVFDVEDDQVCGGVQVGTVEPQAADDVFPAPP